MPKPITTTDLLEQVRSQLDETNTETISDSEILQALNRGQDYATSLLVRQYPDPLLRTATMSAITGQQGYSLPEDIFEDRLQKVEILEAGIAWDVKRINYRDVTNYETSSNVSRPLYYYIVEKEFFLLPVSNGANTIRYWYIRELDPLIKPQGRITTINTTDNYVAVDAVGDDLTTEADDLDSYVNIVDAQTGTIKCSMQVQHIDTDQKRITFKTSPSRDDVYNRTITGEIAATVEEDDYLCISSGNCVPYLKKPLSNYLIQHAVLELKRKLGEPTEAEERAIAKFEDQVEAQWAGREQQLRVKKRSKNWNDIFRRKFTTYV